MTTTQGLALIGLIFLARVVPTPVAWGVAVLAIGAAGAMDRGWL